MQESNHLLEQQVLEAQVFIQNNLDADLSLDRVAHVAGVSPSHFHRRFKQHVGETLKSYVDRLRIEKSVYDITISDLSLLEISARYGFRNPETYSRVFRRILKCTPSSVMSERRGERDKTKRIESYDRRMGIRQSRESNFSISILPDLNVAFCRHIGPYEDVPLITDDVAFPWRAVETFVEQNALAKPPHVYLGIPQDSPETTAPEKLRYDAAIAVSQRFDAFGKVGHQIIQGGYYGVLTHAGSYATLGSSYRELFGYASSLKDFRIKSAPLFELLIDVSAMTIDDHVWTELYLPLNHLRAIA